MDEIKGANKRINPYVITFYKKLFKYKVLFFEYLYKKLTEFFPEALRSNTNATTIILIKDTLSFSSSKVNCR